MVLLLIFFKRARKQILKNQIVTLSSALSCYKGMRDKDTSCAREDELCEAFNSHTFQRKDWLLTGPRRAMGYHVRLWTILPEERVIIYLGALSYVT